MVKTQDLEELQTVLNNSFTLDYGDGLALSKDRLLNLQIQLAQAEQTSRLADAQEQTAAHLGGLLKIFEHVVSGNFNTGFLVYNKGR